MANGPASTSSDNSSSENTTVEPFSIKHDDPEQEILLLKGERLIWTSDLETLKKFVKETVQLHGNGRHRAVQRRLLKVTIID